MSDQRQLGDVGTAVVFENERVRVWEMHLAPGEDSALHRHELDYMLVLLGGDRIAAVPEPDSPGEYNEYFESDVVPGTFVFLRRGGVERARNVGSQPYSELIIELKDPD